jgi:hypothetical protein
MATQNAVSNIVIEPVDLYWGSQHRVCYGVVDDVGGNLGGKYFTFSTPSKKGYVWLNTGSSVDPAPVGYDELAEVAISNDDSASVIAGLIATALNAAAVANGSHAKASGENLFIEAKAMGEPLAAAAAGTSTFELLVQKEGSLLAMGYTDGNVEVGTELGLFDVTAHQTGSELLGQLVTGSTVGPISVVLKETVAARLKEFIEVYGEAYTPAGGTEVSGWGALAGSKQFSNIATLGRKLVLHPTKNDLSDVSGDIAFWNTFPNLTQILISGEENRSLTVDFSIYLDESKVNEVSKFVYGDHTQNFLK